MRSLLHKRVLLEGTSRKAGLTFLLVYIACSVAPVLSVGTELQLVGEDIPGRLPIGSHFIFNQSDTLRLNGRLLQRGIDYRFDTQIGAFDLSSLAHGVGDTLSVVYRELPAWVQRSYGRELPEIQSGAKPGTTAVPPPHVPKRLPTGSSVSLTGAKSFRFSTRSTGSSDFSQSLDLAISGHVSPGLEISGAISDRGHDPSYGTANSRLNELDKINLRLTSTKLRAQIGDIDVDDRFADYPSRGKQVSGASFDFRSRNWSVSGLAARPKGRYAVSRFYGEDARQGPYQIGEGSAAVSVVPGSEVVWLDGRKLERGANKDYTVDYPTGQVTFSVDHPIDSRSRIEVDYEPQSTDYKGELLGGAAGSSTDDSTLTIEMQWLREGDDRGQPLVGELSESDRKLLAGAGDDISLAVRSGVTPDSSGVYVLVTDSLPDSVFVYNGDGGGERFSVTFSYMGERNGDYLFLGSGHYVYVSHGGGDYLPLVRVPAPVRTDYYRTRVVARTALLGETVAEFRQSRFDRNLYSNLDDDDNTGAYYGLQSQRRWLSRGGDNSISVKLYRKDNEYRQRARLYRADLARGFLLPDGYVPATDEWLGELTTVIAPLEFLAVHGDLSRLNYGGEFASRVGGVRVDLLPAPGRLDATVAFRSIRSHLDTAAVRREGRGDNFSGGVKYYPGRQLSVASRFEFDKRRNDYKGEWQGSRFYRYRLELDRQAERLGVEHFVEDTLVGRWTEALRRSRVSMMSDRTVGGIACNLTVSHQWLDGPSVSERSFLGRLGYKYHNTRQRLDLGGAYAMSTETRHGRGVTYLEVEPGKGDYVLEDGRFVPDGDGNYLQVDEILSDRARVRRGRKSFYLNKNWGPFLLRFNSNIEEELLDGGQRNVSWIVPFLSDESQPCLFYSRYYDGDLRLFPVRGFHAINLTFRESRQHRRVAGVDQGSLNRQRAISLKQAVVNLYLKERVELFEIRRDQYYSGAGDIEGFRVGLDLRQQLAAGEISAGAAFRCSESSLDETSEQYIVTFGSRFQVVRKGELRSSVELYRQALSGGDSVPSYSLTDNKSGERGAIWSVSLRYGIKDQLRVKFNLAGRHADTHVARVTCRGEMVAEF